MHKSREPNKSTAVGKIKIIAMIMNEAGAVRAIKKKKNKKYYYLHGGKRKESDPFMMISKPCHCVMFPLKFNHRPL